MKCLLGAFSLLLQLLLHARYTAAQCSKSAVPAQVSLCAWRPGHLENVVPVLVEAVFVERLLGCGGGNAGTADKKDTGRHKAKRGKAHAAGQKPGRFGKV